MSNLPPRSQPSPSVQTIIITPGRFHSFDQARQLAAFGMLAQIISGNPERRLRNERLPAGAITATSSWQYLEHLAGRMRAPSRIRDEIHWRSLESVDRRASRLMKEGRVVIAMSGVGMRPGHEARRRGMKWICDRGSSHISHQDEKLAAAYQNQGFERRPIDSRVVAKELLEYEQSDHILVPTQFAKRTFVDRGIPESKVSVIPYGVDLQEFSPLGEPSEKHFEVLFVGALSVRKGLPALLAAFDQAVINNKRLTLVGVSTPETASMLAKSLEFARGTVRITGSLSRNEVRDRMRQSHVLVLPSVEEGLALVQAQAMACGCPVIATPNTGSEDLFESGTEGQIVPEGQPSAIAERLEQLATDRPYRDRLAAAARARVQSTGGWDRYGEQLRDLIGRIGAD